MFDVVIKGGMVYDGTGGPALQEDIGLRDGVIAALGDLKDAPAQEVCDASGCAVLPGFIDVHTHTDYRMLQKPDREEALLQGVTTEITGACGIGLFPAKDAGYPRVMSGIYGGLAPMFSSCSEYFSSLPETGVNVAVQVSHSPIRLALCGFRDESLPLAGARRLLHQAFDEGACGLSTGLAYYPASFGDTTEVIELCKVAAEYDAPISVHQRTALREGVSFLPPREEVLEFGRRSGVRVQYSHYRTTPKTAGHVDELLEPIERGLAEGLRVTADFYPYPMGAGYALVMLPMWAMEGGYDCIMNRLAEPESRRRIRAYWAHHPEQFFGDCVVLDAGRHREYLNRTFRELAEERHQAVPETILDLLRETELQLAYRLDLPDTGALPPRLEADFVELMQKPYYMFGSDTLPSHGFPHPRSRGAFARLVKLACAHGVSLGVFARAASGLPASTFQLRGRGVLAVGNHGDICVFKPGEVRDRATFAEPMNLADGMRLVLVNGKVAVRDGQITGERAGQKVRRGEF